MKILQIHKYYSRKRGGGSMTAFFETCELLRKKGEEVIIFSMKDKKNESSSYEKYFAEHFDINDAKNLWQKIRLVPKIIWNSEAQKKLEKLIQDEKPDVAHIHNIYHYLTPAIIHTLKKYDIPVVFKLSDYKAICPNYKLFIEGKLCERCRGGKYYNCFLHKCLKNSRSASFVGMLEAYVHKCKKSYEKIDLFLAPSIFMKNKCVEFGIPENKIKILRNAINMEEYENFPVQEEKDCILYFGRISEEKGIADLIKAIKKLFEENKLGNNKLLVVGNGPQKNELKKLTQELKIENKIEFTGPKYGEELKKIISQSKFVVVPSVWYDNSPLVVSEAQLLEKPVVISDLGGTPEMIIPEKSGYIFKAGDSEDLAEKIEKMLGLSQEERRQMGQIGRENIEKINDPEEYYKKLKSVYLSLQA